MISAWRMKKILESTYEWIHRHPFLYLEIYISKVFFTMLHLKIFLKYWIILYIFRISLCVTSPVCYFLTKVRISSLCLNSVLIQNKIQLEPNSIQWNSKVLFTQWNLSIADIQIADMPWIADKTFRPKCDNLF